MSKIYRWVLVFILAIYYKRLPFRCFCQWLKIQYLHGYSWNCNSAIIFLFFSVVSLPLSLCVCVLSNPSLCFGKLHCSFYHQSSYFEISRTNDSCCFFYQRKCSIYFFRFRLASILMIKHIFNLTLILTRPQRNNEK